MKTYKQLKDELFEEVSRIDVSKIPLYSFGGLKDYVDLLIRMADMPDEPRSEILKNNMSLCTGYGLNDIKKEN